MDYANNKKVQVDYLPLPYSTDCVDYPNNRFQSQTDCKLEYMRRKELEICGKNYYWIQYSFDITLQVEDMNLYHYNCTVNANERELEQICKKACKTTVYYSYWKKYVQKYIYYNMIISQIGPISKEYLRISYIPAMTWMSFLSTLGGFISMWLGLCVVDLFNLIFKILRPFLYKIKIELEHFCLRKFAWCNYIKYLFNIIWFSLMTIQLIDLTESFISANEMTSIELRDDYTMPNIRLLIINMEWELNPVCKRQNTTDCYINDILEFSKKLVITLEISNKQEQKRWLLKSFNFTSRIYEYDFTNHLRPYYSLEYLIFDREFYNLSIKDIEININITSIKFNLAYLFNSIYFTNSIFDCDFIEMNSNRLCFQSARHNIQPEHLNIFQFSTDVLQLNHLDNGKECDKSVRTIQSVIAQDKTIIDCITREINNTFHCMPIGLVDWWLKFEQGYNHETYELCRYQKFSWNTFNEYDFTNHLRPYYSLEYLLFDREFYNLNIKDIEININITFIEVNLAYLFNSIYFTNSIFDCSLVKNDSERLCFEGARHTIQPGYLNIFQIKADVLHLNHLDNGKKCDKSVRTVHSIIAQDKSIIDCINREINRTLNCLPFVFVKWWFKFDQGYNHSTYDLCSRYEINWKALDLIEETCFESIETNCEIPIYEAFSSIC